MRFEIAGTVVDPVRVKEICREVATTARVPTKGLLVRVQNYRRGRKTGAFFEADLVFRKGKPIAVKDYIKLYFVSWEKLAETFAHELSHLKDSRLPKVPWGREQRAAMFAQRIVTKMKEA